LKKLVKKTELIMAFTLISIAIELAALSVIYRMLLFTVVKRTIQHVFEKQTW